MLSGPINLPFRATDIPLQVGSMYTRKTYYNKILVLHYSYRIAISDALCDFLRVRPYTQCVSQTLKAMRNRLYYPMHSKKYWHHGYYQNFAMMVKVLPAEKLVLYLLTFLNKIIVKEK